MKNFHFKKRADFSFGLGWVRLFSFLLVFLSLLLFFLTLESTRSKINKPFPGYLIFKNGVVGAYYLPSWSGVRKGIAYHDSVDPPSSKENEFAPQEIFSKRDYLLIVLFPAITGLFFVIMGVGIALFLPAGSGRIPLLLFHALVGNYLILSPEFHLTYHFWFLHLAFFAMIPATMIHFALLFPERARALDRHPRFAAIPYGVSMGLAIPYLIYFLKNPGLWIKIEYGVVFYLMGSYLFWLRRLAITLRRPHLEFNRVIARMLLVGQLVGFTVPWIAGLVIFIGRMAFPLNLASPLVLLFPLSLFIGTIIGRLRQSQIQLIQTEKMATLGNLMAGLAHEINNPLTFVYSNIEPLRERIEKLKQEACGPSVLFKELEDLICNLEEGATRAKTIIDNLRLFSYPQGRIQETIDLNRLLDQSIGLLVLKWKNKVQIRGNYGKIPPVSGSASQWGQVFVNIIANACEAIEGSGKIHISTAVHADQIEISVSDDGKGISKPDLRKIFDPFFTTKPPGEGTGLGLALSLRIVKNYRGSLEVKSERGQGTEVVIKIPIPS